MWYFEIVSHNVNSGIIFRILSEKAKNPIFSVSRCQKPESYNKKPYRTGDARFLTVFLFILLHFVPTKVHYSRVKRTRPWLF